MKPRQRSWLLQVAHRRGRSIRAARLAAVGRGLPTPGDLKRVYLGTYDEETKTADGLCALLLDDYRRKGNRSTLNAMRSWRKHIAENLGRDLDGRALISPGTFTRYEADRAVQGAAPSTRLGELALLKRAMRLARRAGLLTVMPEFPEVGVSNAREGFLSDADLGKLLDALPEHLREPTYWMFLTGWRKRETLGMEWTWIDRDAGTIRLPSSRDKAKAFRVVHYSEHPELHRIIERRWDRNGALVLEIGKPAPHVFFHEVSGGRRRIGGPIRAPNAAWCKVRNAAGLPGLTMHDLRRTAVRNMQRAGVSRSVAMSITGHKTEAIYQRYAIVDERSQREGLARLAERPDAPSPTMT